ncbi:hypothetical protein [Burkholderia pseudomultivorans]|uniref:hypothetical protein n=1 Tax=Burkholderia pseudomultivorans TaxID=1207504 RepID=UPI001582EE81|nr:hypothetical protein [Burkholderia pseudomultivorans]
MITERFKATDNAGKVYEVVVLQDEIDTSDLDGPSSMLGMKEFRLSTGEALNRISENVFRVLRSGIEITRV